MRIATSAAAVLAATLAAAPALSQDRDWTGFYVGGQLGYGFSSGGSDETILFDTDLDGTFGDTVNNQAGANVFSPGTCGGAANGSTPGEGCRSDRNGIEFGAHAGYDIQVGEGFVVGLVTDYTRARVRDSVSTFSTTPAFYTMTRELRDVFTVRARAGVTTGPTLFYGTGGVAYGRIRNSFATDNGVNSFTDSGNERGWGYALGAGAEHRISDGFSIGLQYMYRSISADEYRVRAGPGTAPATHPFLLVNPEGTDFARSSGRFNTHGVTLAGIFRF